MSSNLIIGYLLSVGVVLSGSTLALAENTSRTSGEFLHEGKTGQSIAGLEGDGESSDIVPSAILSTDQAGFETIAIKSGIPSHGAKLVFVKMGARRSGKIVKNPRKKSEPVTCCGYQAEYLI